MSQLVLDNEEDILIILEQITDFDKLNKIFFNIFCEDIVKIIYSYSKTICDECYVCCNLCKIYCHFECLRGNRNLCCKYEFNSLLRDIEKELEKKNNNELNV